MSTQNIIAVTAALLGLAGTQAQATTVASTPVGVTEITIPGGGATSVIGINLIETPPFVGRASAVGASTVTVSGVDLTERLTIGRTYALLVTTGDNAGVNTLVTSWTANQITVQEDMAALLTANEDSFQLQVLPTVLEIFGTGGKTLVGGTAATADRVSVVNPLTGESLTLYYSTGGISGVGWRAIGKGNASYDNTPVYFTDGLSITKKSAGDSGFELAGAVQTAPVSFPVAAGYSSVANVHVASSTLGNSGLYRSGEPLQSLAGGSVTLADQVLFDSNGDGLPETYFYSTGGIAGVGWRRVGGGSTPQTDMPIPDGFAIKKRTGTAEIQRQAPY